MPWDNGIAPSARLTSSFPIVASLSDCSPEAQPSSPASRRLRLRRKRVTPRPVVVFWYDGDALNCADIDDQLGQVWDVSNDPYNLDTLDGPGNGLSCDSYSWSDSSRSKSHRAHDIPSSISEGLIRAFLTPNTWVSLDILSARQSDVAEDKTVKAWHAAFVAISLVLTLARPTLAESPPVLFRSQSDLVLLFPNFAQLPAGMLLADEGSRGAAQIAATFRDPGDAAQVLTTWGWTFNAYRNYVAGPGAGPATPARLEISFHLFASNTGAAYALPYFAHGRAVMLDQQEGPIGFLRPCEAALTGDREATRYLRIGNLLVRVTAVMPNTAPAQAYYLALDAATNVAYTVLGNAGGSAGELDQTCQ